MSNEEDRCARLDSTIRYGRDYWLAYIRWFRNEAISEDRNRGSAAGAVALFGDLINGYTEAGGDVQSLYFEENLNYTLTPEEVISRNGVHSAWLLYENDFYQYSQGLMEDDVWQAKQRGIEILYNRCFARGIYETRAPIFSENFRAIIEQIPDEC